MKVVIIGGGSTYTPELFQGLLDSHAHLPVKEMVLFDIDSDRLEKVGRFCRIMLDKNSGKFALTLSTDIEPALRNADFVIFQLRVGGQAARHRDIKLGCDLGIIGQETTGIGGFAKAMRTIPVVLDYCRKIKAYAKADCKVINFTNPSGIVTQAISDNTDPTVIGVCNVPIILQKQSSELLQAPSSELYFDYVGLNHLGWLRGVYHRGANRIDELVDHLANDPELFRAANHSAIDSSLVRSLRMIPSPYLQYFYYTDQMYAKIRSAEQTRAQVVMELDEKILAHFSTDTSGTLPADMQGRGGELYSYAAVQVMSAIHNNSQNLQIVNIRNGTAIPTLAPDDIIEVPAVIHQRGASPVAIGDVELSILGLIQTVKAYERLTVKAAIYRQYDDALFALFNNPLVKDLAHSKLCLDTLIEREKVGLIEERVYA